MKAKVIGVLIPLHHHFNLVLLTYHELILMLDM
jgi:hypothetical protein